MEGGGGFGNRDGTDIMEEGGIVDGMDGTEELEVSMMGRMEMKGIFQAIVVNV
jgi:hypothetical protein